MLKPPFKKLATVFVAVSLFSQVSMSDEQHANNGSNPVRSENRFSKYDALRDRLEALSKRASATATEPVLVMGTDNVRIQPTRQQFSDGAETIKRVKWYRERMAESCEQSDRSSKLLGEFIDGCLTRDIFEKVKAEGNSEDTKLTFELEAKKMRACRDDITRYFEAKKQNVGELEWRKYVFDQEIMDKLTKFFNWYGASVNIGDSSTAPISSMLKSLKEVNVNNLCLVESESAKEAKKVKLPEGDPRKQAVPGQGPGQPSQEFKPPQVQNPTPQISPAQPQTPAYQPPQGGYQGGNYDPSGIGYRGKYDPRDRGRYNYDNFRDYGDKDYDSPSYIPMLAYPKGGNYTPPSGNHSFPYRPTPPPAQNFNSPPPIASPFFGRGFNLGFGFSSASGFPFGGMYPPLYGGGFGGYGGYGGGLPLYGGIGGGYVSTVPITPIVEPISPCGGLIGGCGGGCGMGFINPNPCNQVCGGLINPIMPCVNNPFINPIGQIPGRIDIPRGPGWNYPWNPFYNYGPMNPIRYTNPRIPGSPWQPINPINPVGPVPNPGIPGNPITPINPITNPVNQPPIRITLPRTP